MTGPEHYREAERLIARSNECYADDPAVVLALEEAQVHATLALAAATALDAVKDYACNRAEVTQWNGIAAPDERTGGVR